MSRTFALTGAASGIGAAAAGLLRDRGDRVISVDLRDADICADLSTVEGRDQAIAEVTDGCAGVLDGLITCAGISHAEVSQVGVNYFGTTELVTGLQPVLAQAAAPRVAIVASIAATQDTDATLVASCLAGDETAARQRAAELVDAQLGFLLYPSTKASLVAWMRRICVTADFAGAGIPINAVGPGVVLTPMSAELIADPVWRPIMDDAVPMPLGGYAPPEAVAHPLVWLTSPENTHITGQIVFVDGGAEAITVHGAEADS